MKPKSDRKIASICFEKIVFEKLEEKAFKEKLPLSTLVNQLIRSLVINDVDFYREKAKFHSMEFYRYNLIKEQLEKDAK